MDYDKIGKFIMEQRKKLGMTQSELAEKLGLTDRAISRWERGVGCPDISLLEPLAKLLNISVLELLHGEKIKDEDAAVVNIIKKNNKKLAVWKYLTLLFINFLLVCLVINSFNNYIIPKLITLNSNYGMGTVISNGMSPALEVYDRVLYKKVDMNDIKIGDIIAIYSPNQVDDKVEDRVIIFHRVTDIYRGANNKLEFITKGDNNTDNDLESVTEKTYIGKVQHVFIGQARKFFTNNGVMPTLMFIFFIIASSSIIFIDMIQIRKIINKKII